MLIQFETDHEKANFVAARTSAYDCEANESFDTVIKVAAKVCKVLML